jgi:hypothetical protein
MTKKLPIPSADRPVLPIPGTRYVLLPDNRIASLLTPTKKSGKDYFALYIDKKRKDYSAEVVIEATVNGKPLSSNS